MADKETNLSDFHRLCERVLTDSLTREELDEFETLVRSRDDFRRYYVEYVEQHAMLYDIKLDRKFRASDRSVGIFSFFGSRTIFSKTALPSCLFLGGVIVSILYFASSTHLFPERETLVSPVEESVLHVATSQEPETFGVIVEKTKCVWDTSSSPIHKGDRVGKRELHLLRGIAQVQYDNDVFLTMEGPVRLELTQRNRCFLHTGKVSAQVSPDGIGFKIDTHTATIEDRGTEFDVQVQDGNNMEVRVFSGRVDVHPSGKERMIPLTSGKKIRFHDLEYDFRSYRENDGSSMLSTPPSAMEYVRTTADGQGQEACVISGGRYEDLNPDLVSKSETLTLVKYASTNKSLWHRKAYFSIDLADLPHTNYFDVSLELTFSHTGVGFASRTVSESVLSIYGLTDEDGDHWDEKTIDWKTAPGNGNGASELDQSKVMMIGQIKVSIHDNDCVKTISGNALRSFIEMDTNRLLTFIVVCETKELQNMGYAHGFANRRHPDLPPPTLRLLRKGESDQEEESLRNEIEYDQSTYK